MHSKGFVIITPIKSKERGKSYEKKTAKYYFPRDRKRIKNDKGKGYEFKSYHDGFYSQVLPGKSNKEI